MMSRDAVEDKSLFGKERKVKEEGRGGMDTATKQKVIRESGLGMEGWGLN